MTKYHVEIELGNEEMQTPYDIANALRELADNIIHRCTLGTINIRDINGNTVGYGAKSKTD